MADSKKGKTLFEMAMEKVRHEDKTPPELKILNPLQARINDWVMLDDAGFEGMRFSLTEIDVFTHRIQGEEFKFNDYILRAGDNWMTLRVNPVTNPERFAKKRYYVLALTRYDKFPYNKDFEDLLVNRELNFNDDKGAVTATYSRLNGVSDPYLAEVLVLSDPAKPVKSENFTYWDYSRTLDDNHVEYCFVERDEQTKELSIFTGVEVSDKDVRILPGNEK